MEHTTKPRYSQTTGGRHSNGTKANLTPSAARRRPGGTPGTRLSIAMERGRG